MKEKTYSAHRSENSILIKMVTLVAWEMAQQGRIFCALTEDLGLAASTHMVPHKPPLGEGNYTHEISTM